VQYSRDAGKLMFMDMSRCDAKICNFAWPRATTDRWLNEARFHNKTSASAAAGDPFLPHGLKTHPVTGADFSRWALTEAEIERRFRKDEQATVEVTGCFKDGKRVEVKGQVCTSKAIFHIKHIVENGAMLSILKTLFIMVVLVSSAYLFSVDTETYVIAPLVRRCWKGAEGAEGGREGQLVAERVNETTPRALRVHNSNVRSFSPPLCPCSSTHPSPPTQPISPPPSISLSLSLSCVQDRMISLVTKLSKNPLQKVEREQDMMQQAASARKQKSTSSQEVVAAPVSDHETAMIEETLAKIGALLQVGFGAAGKNIIAANMQEGEMQVLIPGQKVTAVFGFAIIEHFTETVTCLEAKICMYINSIAKVRAVVCRRALRAIDGGDV
jgi:hypothetical protein